MIADLKPRPVDRARHPRQQEGVALRATFIVDPQGVIRFVSVNDLNVGRNPAEVLRVLDALQTDELCPCNWQKGEQTRRSARAGRVKDAMSTIDQLKDRLPDYARTCGINLGVHRRLDRARRRSQRGAPRCRAR